VAYDRTILIRLSDTGLSFIYSIQIDTIILVCKTVGPVADENVAEDSSYASHEPSD
jgi:hypothetical protein